MAVSKIIHHIAPQDKSQWHPMWDRCLPSWKQNFVDFEHKVWNDSVDIDGLVKEFYPQYWQTYSSFPAHINRIDFARFCILHKFGGIYADMDMFCYTNFYDEISHTVQIVEAPYGENFLENALMSSEKEHSFWIDCMNSSSQYFINHVQNKNLTIPFNDDLHTQRILQSIAGPKLVADVWKKWKKIGEVGSFSGVFFNNHGMSYHPEYRTKHLMTGMWGREAAEEILKDVEMSNRKDFLSRNYIREMREFVDLTETSVASFDFYHDYTNGGMIKHYKIEDESTLEMRYQ